jgi:hypothetical protein
MRLKQPHGLQTFRLFEALVLYLIQPKICRTPTFECRIELCWSIINHERATKDHGRIPQDLLRRALDSSGKGLTATVRQGLERVAAAKGYHQMRRLRGKVRFSIDLRELTEDRRQFCADSH